MMISKNNLIILISSLSMLILVVLFRPTPKYKRTTTDRFTESLELPVQVIPHKTIRPTTTTPPPNPPISEVAEREKAARDLIWALDQADGKAERLINQIGLRANPAYLGDLVVLKEIRSGWEEITLACDEAMTKASDIAQSSLFDSSSYDLVRIYQDLTNHRRDIRYTHLRLMDFIEGLAPGELQRLGPARDESQRLFMRYGQAMTETRKLQLMAMRQRQSLKLRTP